MIMENKNKDRYRGKGTRVCRVCGNTRAQIRKYGLRVCRRCFRDMAESIGFRKYGR